MHRFLSSPDTLTPTPEVLVLSLVPVPTDTHDDSHDTTNSHDADSSHGTTDSHVGDHGIHVPNESAVVLLLFTMLLLGGIMRIVSEKTHIPYTPLLLLSGMLISWLHPDLYI